MSEGGEWRVTVAGQFAVDQSIFRGFGLKMLLIGLSFIRHRRSGQNVSVQLYCVTGQLTYGGSFSVQQKQLLLAVDKACLPRAQLCRNV
jgi:hypothetical protein